MDPGDGAQRQAERAAAAVDEARRRLVIAQKRQHAWQAGAEGERRTAQTLAVLAADGWVVLHDLHWPGRPFANIDHIAVGPGGVVVIDSKNWSGRVDVRDGVLRQNGYRRTKECESAVASVAAVAVWLQPAHRTLVVPLICLVGQPTPTQQPTAVSVVGLADLVARLRSMPARLGREDVAAIAVHLRTLLSGDRSPALLTTAQLTTARLAARASVAHASVGQRPTAKSSHRAPGARVQGTSRRPTQRLRPRGAPLRGFLLKMFILVTVVFAVVPAVASRLGEGIQNTFPVQTPSVPLTTPAEPR